MEIDPQAAELNEAIRSVNPHIMELLSGRGRGIFFPRKGILSQSDEARGSEINATIGIALEDCGSPMALPSLTSLINVPETTAFNYAPSQGRPEIRKLWKSMLQAKNPLLANAGISLPMVTSALTHGLSLCGYLFVDSGDTVIMPDLHWENYEIIFRNGCGASIGDFPTFTPANGFNVAGFRERLLAGKPGKRIVILNFPNNPTGYTVTIDEATQLREALVEAAEAGNSIVVIIDDAYFGLVFEPGILRESIFGLLCAAHPRILAVKLDGPTKEDYVWGFRVGFATFGTALHSAALYKALEAKLAGAIRGTISNSSNLSQTLLLAAYTTESYESEKQEKFAVLKRRYETVRDLIAGHAEYREYFTPLPFNSGYFMCIRIVKGSAEAIRKILIRKYRTGVIAHDDCLRLAFSSTPLPLIGKLLDNIFQAAREYNRNN
jgi:aspartate/methionine/tyrosine aminotransferase